jgi:hypothetical protein
LNCSNDFSSLLLLCSPFHPYCAPFASKLAQTMGPREEDSSNSQGCLGRRISFELLLNKKEWHRTYYKYFIFSYTSIDKQCLCYLFLFWFGSKLSFNMLPFYLTQILHVGGQEKCKILTFVWTFKCTHNTALSTRLGKSYDSL